jgi:SAM-dependent methyltransferase
MNRFALGLLFLREVCGTRTLGREPEPDLVMDDPDHVAAYHGAGRIDGLMSACYLFHSARASQVIGHCRNVLDLGCGSAEQLCQIAQLNPGIHFHGTDLSTGMLEKARANVERLGLKNVTLSHQDMTKLAGVADHSVDAVISTMTLHHLPDRELLRACLRSIRRVLVLNGAIYLADFGRLKQLRSVKFFVKQNVATWPPLFTLDYERSMRAAFERDDFATLCAEEVPGRVKVYSTFGVPMLVVVKTPDGDLAEPVRKRLRELMQAMPAPYRAELNDIRFFFRLGGMGADPFR